MKMAKSLREQLSKISLKKAKFKSGETLAQVLVNEAKRLYECIQKYINEYYDSYNPKIYDRTYRYNRALHAEKIADIRVVGNSLRISVVFDNELSMHQNLSGVYWADESGAESFIPIQGQHKTFVPLLMESGWHAPRLATMIGREVYRLTYFEGIHAVEKGIEDFNKTNKYGIKINADDFYNGKAYI